MSFSIFDWAQEIIENAVFSFFFFIKFIKKKKKTFITLLERIIYYLELQHIKRQC